MLNWWPEHPTKSFFAGKKASCVLGVRNTGQERVNVTYAAATLASPYNASMSLFNFTGQVGATIGLGVGAGSGYSRCEAVGRGCGRWVPAQWVGC